jgi:glyceraldehyde 3-phosphate dehydrogenase
MLRHDTVYGEFDGTIDVDTAGSALIVNGERIAVTAHADPSLIPWSDTGAQYIVDASGKHRTVAECERHINRPSGGAKVLISAPSRDAPMFVMGVNHLDYSPEMTVVSNASCTTNCLAPIARVLHEAYGISGGLATSVHAATSSQKLVDGASLKDWRTGRAAFANIIPAASGVATSLGRVIPELQGKVTGMAYRVPTIAVSLVDLTVQLEQSTTYEQIKDLMRHQAENDLVGILGYVDDQLVSSDFIGDPRSSIFDANAGMALNSNFVKIVAWYDNEWGYANRLVDLLQHMSYVDQLQVDVDDATAAKSATK